MKEVSDAELRTDHWPKGDGLGGVELRRPDLGNPSVDGLWRLTHAIGVLEPPNVGVQPRHEPRAQRGANDVGCNDGLGACCPGLPVDGARLNGAFENHS